MFINFHLINLDFIYVIKGVSYTIRVLAEVGSSLDSLVLQLLFIVKDGLCLNPDPSRLNEHDASVS